MSEQKLISMSNIVNIEIPNSKMKIIDEYDIDIQKLFDKSLNMKINQIKRENPHPELPENILNRIRSIHNYSKNDGKEKLCSFNEGLPYNGISISVGTTRKNSYYIVIKISDISIIPNSNISNTLSESGSFLNKIAMQLINTIHKIDNDTHVKFKLIEHELAENKYDSDNIKFKANIKTK